MGITPKDPAHFDPAMGDYKDLKPFRMWCQKVLPLVYDDSLSYYEVLCKVVDYLNKTMEDVGVLHDDVDALNTAYQQLQSYVNDYFSTLDVQEEINNKLNVMAEDGTLDALLLPYFNAYKTEINGIVENFESSINSTVNIQNQSINTQNDNIATLTSRMDSFARLAEGSTTADAELTDIRIAYNGVTYPTAGVAVRAQASALADNIKYCENLLGNVGKFSPSNSWYTMYGATNYSVSNGVASYTNTQQYGGIKTLNPVTLQNGHSIYYCCKVKSTNAQTLTFDGFGSARSTGNNTFEFISGISTWSATSRYLTVVDGNTSGFGGVKVKDLAIVDLTENFGENIPAKSELDNMFSRTGFFITYPLGIAVSTVFPQVPELRSLAASAEATAQAANTKIGNFITNLLGNAGNFSPANSWYVSNAINYSVSSNIATFKASSQYGGIKTLETFAIPSGHKVYAFAHVKAPTTARLTLAQTGYAVAKGTDDFHFISFVETRGSSAPVNLWCVDSAESDYQTCYIKIAGLIDMTAIFGNDVPTKTQMDNLISNMDFFVDYPLGDFTAKFYGDFVKLGQNGYSNLSNKKIVIMGDSITYTDYIYPDHSMVKVTDSWVTYAMPLLGNSNFVNLAQDGASYHDWNGSGDYQTFTKQYELMVEKQIEPDIIILAFGTNDYQYPHTDTYNQAMAVTSKDNLDKYNWYQCLRWAYWTLTENYPDALIIIGTPLQRADIGPFGWIRDGIKQMGESYCCNIVDAGVQSGIIRQYENEGAAGRYLRDGLHPNQEGKELLGKYWAWAITQYCTPTKM